MKTYIAPDSKRVLVKYSDGTTRETTVAELKDLFKDEKKQWFDNFFYDLQNKFEAYGIFAKYVIMLD